MRRPTLYSTIARLVDELDAANHAAIVTWACPVPFFGRVEEAVVATVGINPSNREFVGFDGHELTGDKRRLPTLGSLALSDWSAATGADLRVVAAGCRDYFERNPYKRWFDVLERMLNQGGMSYYRGKLAAHIDLVAYATATKWGSLPQSVRRALVARGRRTLAEIIRDSRIEAIVLNGRAVVNEFISSAQVELTVTPVEDWTLPRASGSGIIGLKYSGSLTSIAGIELDRSIKVIGYNHNLQSSFGVTNAVVRRIAKEVGETVGDPSVCTAR